MATGAVAGGVLGAAFDQITLTISPEYFLEGKALSSSTLPVRLAAAWIGFRGGLPLGALVVGAALLDAQRRAGLGWREWITDIGKSAALFLPACAASMLALDPFGVRFDSAGHWTPERATRYLLCWGLHAGAYAAVGVASVRRIVSSLRKSRPPPAGARS